MLVLPFLTDTIFYDDACHLKKFAQNKKRWSLTSTSQKMATMKILCDRFHFKNHVDQWCRNNCNPNKFDGLKVSAILHPNLLRQRHNKSVLNYI